MVRNYIYHINWCRISSIKQYLQIRLLIDLRFAHFGCRFFKGGQNALHPRLPQVLGARRKIFRNETWYGTQSLKRYLFDVCIKHMKS